MADGTAHISGPLVEFLSLLDRIRQRRPELAKECRAIAEGTLRDAERPPVMPWAHPQELGPSPIRWYLKPIDDPLRKHVEDEDVCESCLPGRPGSPAFVAACLRAYVPGHALPGDPGVCSRCGRAREDGGRT